MRNLYPAIKWEGLGIQRHLVLAEDICQETNLPQAGPNCLPSDSSCPGQTVQTFTIIAYRFVFKLLGCQKALPSCQNYAAWYSGVATRRCGKIPMLARLRTKHKGSVGLHAQPKLSRAGELAPHPSQKDPESPSAQQRLFLVCVQVASVFLNT